jgi:hypothetical protein
MKLKRAQGGAFETGGNQYYNGGGIALKYNTIVVVANYRLGLAGFFVSSGTVSEGSNGNYVRFYWNEKVSEMTGVRVSWTSSWL